MSAGARTLTGTTLADARTLTGTALAEALRDSRATSLARTFDLPSWTVPQKSGVNPIDWELGHIAWFGEFWILRGPHALDDQSGIVAAARPPRIAGPDAVFDSARLAHAERWRTPMPTRSELAARLATQLEACIAAIDAEDDDAADEMHRLVLFHEDMHGEAFAWLRATLAWPAPPGLASIAAIDAGPPLRLPGGVAEIGRPAAATGYAFDNEQPAQHVPLAPFEIDARPVSNGEFAAFVDAGGYDDDRLWPGAAARWRATATRRRPERWRRDANGEWQARWFDRWQAPDPQAPVVHVNAFEAEAYARWAGRRLPRAAEWEQAAREPAFRWGTSVWEWTADAFAPYPGFAAGPYRDYSAPWFGDHRELRGGSFATHARLHDRRYRNFFLPQRSDVFAGLRTAADA